MLKVYGLWLISPMRLDCRKVILPPNESLKPTSYPLLREITRDKKWTHINTTDNPIFKHIQWIWNSIFWLAGQNLRNYKQYDKIENTSYQRQVVKHHLFLISNHLTFNKHIYLGPTQSLRGILDVWTYRVLG